MLFFIIYFTETESIVLNFVSGVGRPLPPGSAFGNPECLRISYAASDDTLKEALDRIERALDPEVYTVA
jgi:aspartate/methionine/tyrosine aminotransferase